MLLLEKQGLCSQQQRSGVVERCGSLPPSSLPRPKRHHKSASSAGKERKLGEYGRLSDGEGSSSTSRNASAADTCESPVRSMQPRKLGDYNRLDDSTGRSSDSTDKSRDSPGRGSVLPIPPRKLGEYGRLSSDRTNTEHPDMTRSSPVRYSPSRFSNKDKIGDYNRKLSTGSDKTRDSPSRSLLPPPKKLPDYSSCFEAGASSQPRLLPVTRRGSLGHGSSSKANANEPGVRSLPPPNKYRIQF